MAQYIKTLEPSVKTPVVYPELTWQKERTDFNKLPISVP